MRRGDYGPLGSLKDFVRRMVCRAGNKRKNKAMKKLIIAAFAVACAAMVQAATVQWQSGALYTAASAEGGWSSTLVNNASPQALVTMSVYLVDATTYATVSAYDQAGIYEWASTQTATYTAQNKNATTGAIIGAATVIDSDFAGSTTFYSILTAEYTDATYGDMYMAAAATATTPASGQKNITNIFGGASTATTGGVRDWQPVPEPTSGLLMLLGFAGLALRRKQK